MCLGRRPAHGCAMNITTAPTSLTTHDTVKRPGRGRRAALVGASVLTCALPLMWTANITRMLLTGVESEHRFHQATGQGLILFAFWLGALIPLIRSRAGCVAGADISRYGRRAATGDVAAPHTDDHGGRHR